MGELLRDKAPPSNIQQGVLILEVSTEFSMGTKCMCYPIRCLSNAARHPVSFSRLRRTGVGS
eukprot:199705-Pleurochrysis_carterae.AAC.2